jgi:hypothetical protein
MATGQAARKAATGTRDNGPLSLPSVIVFHAAHQNASRLSPVHLGEANMPFRPDADAADGVVHCVRAGRSGHGRDLGAEPAAGSGDRLVPRCSSQFLASPLQVTGLVNPSGAGVRAAQRDLRKTAGYACGAARRDSARACGHAVTGESGSGDAWRASVILARAQRRDVCPNSWASLRSDSGLPACTLSRYAATAAS